MAICPYTVLFGGCMMINAIFENPYGFAFAAVLYLAHQVANHGRK